MKNKIERKERFALTLLFSLLVLAIILVAALLAVVIVYVLLKIGVISSIDDKVNFTDIVLFLMLISTVIGFLLSLLVSKLSLKPVNKLVNRLNSLARGDFAVRLRFGKPICAHSTFKEIENSFNRAAEELQQTELLRSDFTNNFSHEFKTPIVSIAGFAKLLRHGNLTEPQKQEYLAVIEEESMRLAAMATNVLSLTRVENQAILTDITQFNLSEQLRSAVLLLEEKWAQKDIEPDVEFGEYTVSANEELLKQVWINLIDNAVKFSPTGGKLSVAIADLGNDVEVSVANSGSEIPKESMPLIFNKFYQADTSHSTEGSGVGLAIVKKIVALHGGDVRAESTDGVTTFYVRLPKTQR